MRHAIEPLTDELDRLAGRARDGDARAFRRLAEAVAPALHRLAWRVLGDTMLAADAVQETLIKAAENLRGYDPGRPVMPWLRRIAGRAALDIRRAELALPRSGLDEAAEVPAPAAGRPDADLATMETRDLLQTLAADLTPRQRTVFAMRDLEDVPTAEIALALDMSESTVRVHLARARERVRDNWLRHQAKEASR